MPFPTIQPAPPVVYRVTNTVAGHASLIDTGQLGVYWAWASTAPLGKFLMEEAGDE